MDARATYSDSGKPRTAHPEGSSASPLIRPCPVCRSTSTDIWLTIPHGSLDLGDSDWVLVRCAECDLLYSANLPAAGLTQVYLDDPFYSRIFHDSQRSTNRLNFESILSPSHVEMCLNAVGAVPRGRVLEIGCGSGSLLISLSKLGWSPEGVELSREIEEALAPFGIPVHVGQFEAINLEGRKFELIVMFDVIEHTLDPVLFLSKAFRLLTPGGRILLSTPNFEGIRARVEGPYWTGVHAPFHIVLFNRQSLRLVIERAGGRVIREREVSTLAATALGFIGATLRFMSRSNSGERISRSGMAGLPVTKSKWMPLAILAGLFVGPLEFLLERITRRQDAIYFVAEKRCE